MATMALQQRLGTSKNGALLLGGLRLFEDRLAVIADPFFDLSPTRSKSHIVDASSMKSLRKRSNAQDGSRTILILSRCPGVPSHQESRCVFSWNRLNIEILHGRMCKLNRVQNFKGFFLPAAFTEFFTKIRSALIFEPSLEILTKAVDLDELEILLFIGKQEGGQSHQKKRDSGRLHSVLQWGPHEGCTLSSRIDHPAPAFPLRRAAA